MRFIKEGTKNSVLIISFLTRNFYKFKPEKKEQRMKWCWWTKVKTLLVHKHVPLKRFTKKKNGWEREKKTRLKNPSSTSIWKSKWEDPAIFTHPHSHPIPLLPLLLTSSRDLYLLFFRWFFFCCCCDYRPCVCRNVYAILMNCFSARIPTELKLFNFPYISLLFLDFVLLNVFRFFVCWQLLMHAFWIDFVWMCEPHAVANLIRTRFIVFSLRSAS